MEENRRGYTLPYAANPGVQIAWIAIGLVAMAASFWLYREESPAMLWVVALVFIPIILFYAGQLAARLHIVPRGIAITLFGVTLRRLPAEKVCVMAALRKYGNKANPHDMLAICTNTVEELTVLGNKHIPKLLQNEADRWYGQTAANYLYRRAVSFRGELNLHRHILWLDWSPERLKLLREIYPDAVWLDGTEKKIFDAQLK